MGCKNLIVLLARLWLEARTSFYRPIDLRCVVFWFVESFRGYGSGATVQGLRFSVRLPLL
jgi:hypothetical protein